MTFPIEYYGLFFCIPMVAFLYASVGHGGASGYIALMFLFDFPALGMKPAALTINLFVAAIAFYHFWKQGFFKVNLFLYFAIGSIPFSFIGGTIKLSPLFYYSLLALFLLFSIIKLTGLLSKNSVSKLKSVKPFVAVGIGAIIGLSSGLIGIGGGIILSPLLLLLNWASIKQAAAVSALFIWVNSAAGLAGQIQQGVEIPKVTIILVFLAILGGTAGAYIGANKISDKAVKGLLVSVLIIALGKLVNSIWLIA